MRCKQSIGTENSMETLWKQHGYVNQNTQYQLNVYPDILWVWINDERMALQLHYLESECIGPSDIKFLVFGDVQSNASLNSAVYVYNLIY